MHLLGGDEIVLANVSVDALEFPHGEAVPRRQVT